MIDLNCDMRFMSNNFLSTGYSSLKASSADSLSELSLLNDNQRSKTYKFNGCYKVEYDVNDRIYLTIGGVDYSLRMPFGEYDNDSLATKFIEVIFAATGNADIQLIRSSYFNKWFFISVTSSPFTVRASIKTNAFWEAIGFYDTANIAAASIPYSESTNTFGVTADVTRFHWPCEYIQVDFGYQANIGFIGIIGNLNDEIKIPQGARVRFMANNVPNFTSPVIDVDLTWSKHVVYKFLDTIDDSFFRYVRLEIICPEGPITPEIGQLYIGDYSKFYNRNVSTGIKFGFNDFSDSSSAEAGQIFSNKKYPLRIIQGLKVGLAKPENITFLKDLFLLKQKNIPFFAAIDPKGHITSSVDELLVYCRFSQEPANDHIIYKFYEISFELTEAL